MDDDEDDDDEGVDEDDEDEEGEHPGKAAGGLRGRLPQVGNNGYHLQLRSRSPSPERGQDDKPKRRRRLNTEELAVADGLLGLGEVNTSLQGVPGTPFQAYSEFNWSCNPSGIL